MSEPTTVETIIAILLLLLTLYIFIKLLHFFIPEFRIGSTLLKRRIFGSYTRRQLTSTSPKNFEYKVAEYYETLGYDSLVTRQSGEDGVDVIARGNGEDIAVQAKRYQLSNKVGAKTVKNTHQAMKCIRADRAAVVTSSRFRDSAKEKAEELDVDLVNGREMIQVLNKNN